MCRPFRTILVVICMFLLALLLTLFNEISMLYSDQHRSTNQELLDVPWTFRPTNDHDPLSPQFKSNSIMESENRSSQLSLETRRSSRSKKTGPFRKWAYAFLIGGCHPDKPIDYLGYIYNVAIASNILKQSGSVAEIVVMVQMARDTNATKLPPEHESMLTMLPDVRVQYLPKPELEESFYSVIMEKFRVLELIEYSRVLFLDSDLMPFCNLDYLLDASEPVDAGKPAMFLENVLFSWFNTPANAGTFILKPVAGDWDLLRTIWKERMIQDAKELPYPHFDKHRGWGKVMKPPYDYARYLQNKTVQTWEWYGVIADQGLLYYWAKYVKKRVTIISTYFLEHWTPVTAQDVAEHPDANWTIGEDVAPHLELNNLKRISCVRNQEHKVRPYLAIGPVLKILAPYRDFKHFTGKTKPWENTLNYIVTDPTTAHEYWFYQLRLLQTTVLKNNPHLQSIDVAALPSRKHRSLDFPMHAKAKEIAKQFEMEKRKEKFPER